jgi:anthranilate synthase/aminodeoxychorismate synthase-like glutamine amidotransferase
MATAMTTITAMILVLDNYDSFTWNLVHAIGQQRPGADVRVMRNDELDVHQLASLALSALVISPGPCSPSESGICRDAVRALAGRVPILGVCLGHQAMADAFGMRVVRAPEPVHGKVSAIEHDGRGIFEGIPCPMTVARYHSLVVDRSSVSGPFEVSAWTLEGLVMGLRWTGPGAREVPMDGVQFHPESFLTGEGPAVLGNFLRSVS